jgi:hypothetical protein
MSSRWVQTTAGTPSAARRAIEVAVSPALVRNDDGSGERPGGASAASVWMRAPIRSAYGATVSTQRLAGELTTRRGA